MQRNGDDKRRVFEDYDFERAKFLNCAHHSFTLVPIFLYD